MGIQLDSRRKRRATGGKRALYRKHRKFLLGRQAAHTKLGDTRVRPIRVRGGNIKLRALRLDSGIFSWGAEGISRKARILNVVYNGANNEFVRTNTLVRGEVVEIDPSPFRLWWESYYGVPLKKAKKAIVHGVKTKGKPKTGAKPAAKKAPKAEKPATEKPAADEKSDKPAQPAAKKAKTSAKTGAKPAAGKAEARVLTRAQRKRAHKRAMDPAFEDQLNAGHIYAMITSRPGQTGRIDGYLLDGKELEFYMKKLKKKSGK